MPQFYSIYFTRNGQVVRLPINPAELPETKDGDNGEYNVLGVGPVTVPRIPKQREIKISSYFPGRASGTGISSLLMWRPPEYFIKFFQSAMDDREPVLYTPVRFYENGRPFAITHTGFPVLITRFDTKEKGGETGDFYFELDAKEWRDFSPRGVQIQATSPPDRSAPQEAPASRTKAVSVFAPRVAQGAVVVLKAMAEPVRAIPPRQMVVGSRATLNGKIYESARKDGAGIPAAGRSVVVARILFDPMGAPIFVRDPSGRPLGWVERKALTVIQNAD